MGGGCPAKRSVGRMAADKPDSNRSNPEGLLCAAMIKTILEAEKSKWELVGMLS